MKMTNTKYRIFGLLLAAIFVLTAFPIESFAKNNDVTITSASATGTSVTVAGTTTAKAVIVQIRDANNNVKGMGSLGVSGGSFSGTISNFRLAAGDYTVYVADYEGGTWATSDVNVAVGAEIPTSSSASSYVAPTSSCINGHDYQYTIVQEPTRTKDGYAAYVCTGCGAIDKNRPGADYRGYIRLPSYWQYQKESIAAIKAAPAGTLTINAEFWISFHKSVYDEIEKRPDLTVSVVFTWEDQDYIVTIPAGTKAEDIMDGLDYAGYVHVSSLFGCQPTVRER